METLTTSPVRRRLLIGGGALAAIVVALLGWYFLRGAPGEVSIAEAVGAADAGSSAEAGTAEVDPQGTWTVDTDAQPYSLEESTGTFVGFRIQEELARVGAATAVGRTPVVTGTLTLDGTVVTEATFSGDLSQLRTDESRRDSRTRSSLEVDEFPLTTFTLTAPIDLGAEPTVGATITATAIGDLTIAGVTRTVEVPLEAALSSSGLLVVTGSFDVALADHDIEKPSSTAVLGIADVATVEVQLYLTRS